MFAVPGWAISSDSLVAESSSGPSRIREGDPSGQVPKPNKKRKRKSHADHPGSVVVDSENVADLWEAIIERKAPSYERSEKTQNADKSQTIPSQRSEQQKYGALSLPKDGPERLKAPEVAKQKRQRKRKKKDSAIPTGDTPTEPTAHHEPTPSIKPHASDSPDNTKKGQNSPTSEFHARNSASSQQVVQHGPSLNAKLTPLQAQMAQKLLSSRFRHLNQSLYTTSSTEAAGLFLASPESFDEYHAGFSRQVESWPVNPVDLMIQRVLERGGIKSASYAHVGKHRQDNLDAPRSAQAQPGHVEPLPRTKGTCRIADLGCGTGKLATNLHDINAPKRLRLQIHSFDLVSNSSLVTVADIASIPLADGSVDVAVLCLSLMGTNWLDFIEEAYRILRWKGEAWIVEVVSRFARKGDKAKAKKQSQQQKVRPKDMEREERETGSLLEVAVDGADDRSNETDVEPFVEACRRRGLVLLGEPERNKMFVGMRFIKMAQPTQGKGANANRATFPSESEKQSGTWRAKAKLKFIEKDKQDDDVDESTILKPCVYKLR